MPSIINASTNNTTGLIYSADASGVLALQGNGTTGLTVGNTGNVTVSTNLFVSGSSVQPLVSGTAQNTTSGTSIDFTGIPSWVRRITVIMQNLSSTGTSNYIIRLGTSSGYVNTGYASTATSYGGGSLGSISQFTTGFGVTGGVAASSRFSGIMTITNISANNWVNGIFGGFHDATYSGTGGGYVDAGGVVNSVRLTTVNGTDTFDSGSINIMYE